MRLGYVSGGAGSAGGLRECGRLEGRGKRGEALQEEKEMVMLGVCV